VGGGDGRLNGHLSKELTLVAGVARATCSRGHPADAPEAGGIALIRPPSVQLRAN
jgi:hypothetical protein